MKFKYIALLIFASIPTFIRMLRPGIFTMQDFHYFRLVEFEKCILDGQIPCRWAADAGLGFGEPVFNFYGQVPYLAGELFRVFGFSFVDSIKLLFIFSLLGSAFSMFFLAKHLWESELAAFISSMIYLYAPYRAVDVWVRGALSEAIAFVIFPLVLLMLEKYFEKSKKIYLLGLSLVLSILIATHNLSFVMFIPVVVSWTIYRAFGLKKQRAIIHVFLASVFSFLLASFYVLPVIFESKYIQLENTILGYFDFRGHFTSLYQLLFSRNWEYGASLFGPDDDINLSVGIIQWSLPLVIILASLLGGKIKKNKSVLVLTILGYFFLFITHTRSTPIWESLPFMAYIQFPWRFLGIATFCFALASGAVVNLTKKYLEMMVGVVFLLTFLLSFSFYREDIWQNVGDEDLMAGDYWNTMTLASMGDYWPIYGDIPLATAPDAYEGTELVKKSSVIREYKILGTSSKISFPVTFFPGWAAYIDNEEAPIHYDEQGLIEIDGLENTKKVVLSFKDTMIRRTGNATSLISIVLLLLLFRKYQKDEKY